MLTHPLAALLDAAVESGVLDAADVRALERDVSERSVRPDDLVSELAESGRLTPFQADHVVKGQSKDLVLGPYVLLDMLGQGGMGRVYKARHRLMDRIVAIKVIRPDRVASRDAVARFRREVQAAARVAHPNVVLAYDAAQSGDSHFLVMEYVDGTDLARIIKERGALAAHQACDYIRQALVGMQHAHECGLVHRDLKPANLLLARRDETVKVLDLGLARFEQNDPQTDAELTSEGVVMGTPDYMAPEQSLDSRRADIRADIYSLGCTLYHLMTGRPPFPGGTAMEKFLKHREIDPIPAWTLCAGVPRSLGDQLRRLMAKRPEERYQTPGEAAAALEPYCDGTSSGDSRAALLKTRLTVPPLFEPAEVASTESAIDAIVTDQDAPGLLAKPAPSVASSRRGLRVAVGTSAVAALIVIGSLLAAQFVLRIKHPSAEETEVRVPKGSKIEIGAKGGVKIALPGNVIIPHQITSHVDAPLLIPAEPLLLTPGAAMGPFAIVQKPVPLAGVRSWTIEPYGHRGDIKGMALSADGRWVATASYDGTIRIWDYSSGKLDRLLISDAGKGHGAFDEYTASVRWSPDGQFLATSCDSNTVQIWAVVNGQLLRTLKGNGDGVTSIAWSPRGRILAADNGGSTVRLWDVVSSEVVRSFKTGRHRILSLAWSPDGKTLAVGGVAKEVQLWDADSVKPARVLKAGGAFFAMTATNVRQLAWSPDGTKIACAANGGNIVQSWDIASGQPQLALEGANKHILSVAWSPDGRRLAAGGDFSGIRVWDADSGSLLYTSWGNYFRVHAVAFTPDGKALLAAGSGPSVLVRDPTTGEVIRDIPPHEQQTAGTNCIEWSPDDRMLASSGSFETTVRLWDRETGGLLRSTGSGYIRGSRDMISGVAWSPNGKWLASGSNDGKLRLWEAQSGQELATFESRVGPIHCVAWSPDGKLLADGERHAVQIWDVNAHKTVHVLEEHAGAVLDVRWSADGAYLASLDQEGPVIRIWQISTGKLLHTLSGLDKIIGWSTHGHTLVARDLKETIQFRDGETGASVSSISMADAPSSYRSYASYVKQPDNSAPNRSGSHWEFGAPAAELPLPPHTSSILKRAWSHDGNTLATCSRGQIRLWDGKSGKCRLAVLTLPNDQGVAIMPDGHYRGTAKIDELLVYVVQTERGQRVLPTDQFALAYGWKNNPDRVRLHAPVHEGGAPVRAPKPAPVVIKAEHISLPQGQPLNEVALVQQPAKLKGTKTWTIETLGHRASVRGLAYSPNGRWLASASVDGTIRLWDTDSGELARILVGHTGRERSDPTRVALAWSPDSAALASTLADRDVQVWEVATGRLLRNLRGHQDPVCAVAWSPDGKSIATAGLDMNVRLWPAASDEAPLAIPIPAWVRALDWSPDGAALALGGHDKLVRVWDVKSKQVARVLPADGCVYAVAWSPAADRLACAAGDAQAAQIWKADSGELLKTLKTKSTIASVAWSPDGSRLAGGDRGGYVTVWDSEFGLPVASFAVSDDCNSVAWSTDGNTLAAGSRDGIVTLVDPDSRLIRGTLPPAGTQNVGAVALAWSRNGKQVANASRDGTIRLWDSASARMAATLEGSAKLRLRALAYSPKGNLLASSGSEFSPNNASEPDVRLWNTETGRLVATLKPHNLEVLALAWSPGGEMLATGSGEQIRVWDISERKPIAVFGGQDGAIEMGLAWSPNGRMLAAVDSGSPIVRLWEPLSRTLAYALGGHTKPVWAVAWSPDGKTVISGGQDLFARFWDVESGKTVSVKPLSTYWVHPLAVSPDGKVLAYNGRMCEIRFLEGESDDEAHSLYGHASDVLRIDWSPDGKKLASSDQGGVTRVWDFATRTCDYNLLTLPHHQGVAINPVGHYRGTPQIEKLLRYVVQFEDHQESLRSEEFARRFGWKNDPERCIGVGPHEQSGAQNQSPP
jgi:WD40 repeat protein/serine/threonine protein kinase